MPFLRFSSDAQGLFAEWNEDIVRQARSAESDALQGHLVKFTKLVPALALVFQLLEDPTAGTVSLSSATLAAAWADFLGAHARRIYASADAGAVSGARRVLQAIRSGDLVAPFTGRDVYVRHWAGLATPDDAEAALAVLERHRWVRRVDVTWEQTGGRPRTEYHVHPATQAKRAA